MLQWLKGLSRKQKSKKAKKDPYWDKQPCDLPAAERHRSRFNEVFPPAISSTQKGTWYIFWDDNYRAIMVTCPGCGQARPIHSTDPEESSHTINKDGTVEPSLLCIGCKYHGFIALGGWWAGRLQRTTNKYDASRQREQVSEHPLWFNRAALGSD